MTITNETPIQRFWSAVDWRHYLNRRPDKYPLSQLQIEDIAAHVTEALKAITYFDGGVVLYSGKYGISIEFNLFGGVVDYDPRSPIQAIGLIEYEGVYGASWDSYLLSVAANRAVEISEGFSENDSVQDAVRAGLSAIELVDPSLIARTRREVGEYISAHLNGPLVEQVKLFDEWIKRPCDAQRIAEILSECDFDARDLSDREYAVVWDWMSMRMSNAQVEYIFDPSFDERTIEDMEAMVLRYPQELDEALYRYTDGCR